MSEKSGRNYRFIHILRLCSIHLVGGPLAANKPIFRGWVSPPGGDNEFGRQRV
jgi:hypothetical protein